MPPTSTITPLYFGQRQTLLWNISLVSSVIYYICCSTRRHVSCSRAHFSFISSLNHGIANIYPFFCCFPWPPCFEKFLTWLRLTSAAAVLFLSCSASDQGLTGNCHCDGCQVLGCGQALTFASFGYTSCQLMDRKCTNTSTKKKKASTKSSCWLIPKSKKLFNACLFSLLNPCSC